MVVEEEGEGKDDEEEEEEEEEEGNDDPGRCRCPCRRHIEQQNSGEACVCPRLCCAYCWCGSSQLTMLT